MNYQPVLNIINYVSDSTVIRVFSWVNQYLGTHILRGLLYISTVGSTAQTLLVSLEVCIPQHAHVVLYLGQWDW